jgi:5-methylcytosine-specific restriction endonuclease McrBC GTP-binding regulatory subunit McrB
MTYFQGAIRKISEEDYNNILNISPSKNLLSFVDLQKFLLEEMQMGANYQPIMIRTLLHSGGKATRADIAAKIKELNPDKEGWDLKNIPVYDVLENRGIVKKDSNNEFILNSEELTEEQRQQLIALCNWKIYNMPLQPEELIEAFDKNRNLFDPNRTSLEELETLRSAFVSDFPLEKILQLQLDEYVAGKPDPKTGGVNKSTFCYRLEHEMAKLSRFGVRTALDFGIYYNRENQEYLYNNKEKYGSPQEAFDVIKSEIHSILKVGEQYHIDHNLDALLGSLERKYNISRQIRSKILSLYYPEDFIAIHNLEMLETILGSFGKTTDNVHGRFFMAQAQLLEVKSSHPIMRQWYNNDFSYFVWHAIIERSNASTKKLDKLSVWVVRAGSKGEQENDALERNIVTIAWNQLPDLSHIDNRQSIKQLYFKIDPNAKKISVSNMVGSIWRFVNEIKKGDLVVLPLLSQNSKTIAIGRVEGDYDYKEFTPDIKHIRSVKWLAKNVLKSEFDEDMIKQFHIRLTVYEIKGNDVIEKIKKVLNRYDISDIDINGTNLVEGEFKKETHMAINLEDVSRQTYFPIDIIREIEILLNEKKQIIFYGPPGTSKTYFAKLFARYFTGNPNNIALIQFHPSYSYEDFIEGIKPNLSETGQAIGFSKQDGFFKKLVNKCNADPNGKYVLIIDEINRGNIAKIFGELIYLLEYRREKVVLTYSPNESFSIPSNLYLIGTMNSADRSIAFVDYALRRRFYFRNFYPDSNVNLLREWFKDHPPNQINAENVIRMIEEINKVIVERLGREYQIGYSYLMKEDLDNNALSRIINYAIMPLLEQYFFGKKERLEELKEICNRATMPV